MATSLKYRSISELTVGTRPYHVTITVDNGVGHPPRPEVEISINTGNELHRFITQLRNAEQEIQQRIRAELTEKEN